MPKLTIIISLVLVLLGLIAYFGLAKADERSVTALIPAFFGIGILLCGLFALNPGARKASMHVAMLLAFLGFLAPLGRLIPTSIKNGFTLDAKSGTMIVMSVLCLFLLVAGIRSFVAARRA
jgi:hypothetical protein